MNSGIGIIWAPVSAGTLVIWRLGIFVAVVGMVWFVKRLKKRFNYKIKEGFRKRSPFILNPYLSL